MARPTAATGRGVARPTAATGRGVARPTAAKSRRAAGGGRSSASQQAAPPQTPADAYREYARRDYGGGRPRQQAAPSSQGRGSDCDSAWWYAPPVRDAHARAAGRAAAAAAAAAATLATASTDGLAPH